MLLLGHWPALVGADARLFELRPVAGIDGGSLMGHRVGSCAFSPITLVDSAIPIISVFQVAEDLLGGAVVEAVPLARHALGYLRLPRGGASTSRAGTASPCPECSTGLAPSGILSSSRSSRSSCCSMLGLVEVDQATISLLPKSYTGAKYALPQGCLNSGDVGAHLLPWRVGGEVAPYDVLEGLAHDALV